MLFVECIEECIHCSLYRILLYGLTYELCSATSPALLMEDDKLGLARASSSSLQKRSRVQDQQHHKPKTTVTMAASNTRIESLPPLPYVSATAGKPDLHLIDRLPKSTNDRGANHFQPTKNQDTQTSLHIQAFHKQAQLELGQSTIVPSGTHTNIHSFSGKNIDFSHLDIKLPKLISKGDIMSSKTNKKPGEIPLPQLLQSSVALSKPSLSEVGRKRLCVSHTMSIEEENDMWSKIAIIENKIDQMEEGKRAQYRTRNSHIYHRPVVSVTDNLATVPKPWPINLIVVHTNKRRPESGHDNALPAVYYNNDHAKVTRPQEEYKFGWKIRKISKRLEEAELSRAPFYSTIFTTGHNGYIMCLEAYLSGDGQDTHVSLYLVMLDPDHGHSLAWPFIKPVTFQLINQVDPAKSISMSFISQLWSPSLNVAKWKDGLPRFFRRHLLLSYNNFNKDDQIIIKCKIDLNYNGKFIRAV